MWNSSTDKIIVTSQTWGFWTKTTFIQAICHNLEKRRADSFLQDYPNAIRFSFVHLSPSMLLFPFVVFLLCCSTALSGYCNVSFYFLGILVVTKLHRFAWHFPFRFVSRWKVNNSTSHFVFVKTLILVRHVESSRPDPGYTSVDLGRGSAVLPRGPTATSVPRNNGPLDPSALYAEPHKKRSKRSRGELSEPTVGTFGYAPFPKWPPV